MQVILRNNLHSNAELTEHIFRHDFHQILAYCSMNSMPTKQGILVYPFSDFACHKMKVNSPITHSEAFVYLVGIPIEKKRIEEVKEKLGSFICLNK